MSRLDDYSFGPAIVFNVVVVTLVTTEYHLNRDGSHELKRLVGNPVTFAIELTANDLVSLVEILFEVAADITNYFARISIELPLNPSISQQ
jgi:hypothetical protein